MKSKRSQTHNDEAMVKRLNSLFTEIGASREAASARATYIRALKGASAEQSLDHIKRIVRRAGGACPTDVECGVIEKLANLSGHRQPAHVRSGAVKELARLFRLPPSSVVAALAVNLCGAAALYYITRSLVHWANAHATLAMGGVAEASIAYNMLVDMIEMSRESVAQDKHPHRLPARALDLSREEIDGVCTLLTGGNFRDTYFAKPRAYGSRIVPFLIAHAANNEDALRWMMSENSGFSIGESEGEFLVRLAIAADLPDVYSFASHPNLRSPRANALNAAALESPKVVAHILQTVGEWNLALSVTDVQWNRHMISSFACEDGLRLGAMHAWLDNVTSDRQLFLDMITRNFPSLVIEFLAEDFGNSKEI